MSGVVFLGPLVVALLLIHRPFGDDIARVVRSPRHLRVERAIYRVGGVDPDADQSAGSYLRSVLAFSAVSVLVLYAFLRLQQHFASGSGLDPDISPAYAKLQEASVARARGMTVAQVAALVTKYQHGRDLGFLGDRRVNVLRLNLALDQQYPVR